MTVSFEVFCFHIAVKPTTFHRRKTALGRQTSSEATQGLPYENSLQLVLWRTSPKVLAYGPYPCCLATQPCREGKH